LDVLLQFKSLGVTIAIDDFGTGYSSLDTLRAFPFDRIKLDRSFMREVETSRRERAILQAVVTLGDSLDMNVLAEGIETEGQLALLLDTGCREAQGYLFGRPAPLAAIVASGALSLKPPAPTGSEIWEIGEFEPSQRASARDRRVGVGD
jgi:EAL domain-containing protein (putative c-di-GMP-specific phosphodiesterase class I)